MQFADIGAGVEGKGGVEWRSSIGEGARGWAGSVRLIAWWCAQEGRGGRAEEVLCDDREEVSHKQGQRHAVFFICRI